MSENLIQNSFMAGELAPSMFARTDLTKYHQGAATMRNWFVDYRSGASTRMGTKFVSQGFKSSKAIRLIPFQSSVLTPYILEFGDFYMRVYSMGASVLEPAFAVSAITNANPTRVTATGNNFNTGDWIFLAGSGGMPQIGGRFFTVVGSGNSFNLADVNGNPINSLAYGTYTGSGITASRVYTNTGSPYAAADLALLKFIQVGNVMYFTHPNYQPYTLTFTSATSWTWTQISFGTTISAPTNVAASSSSAGSAAYAYVVTSVDANNQESLPSTPGTVGSAVNITTTAGTIQVTWTAATGAVSYNVYKAELTLTGAVPSGAAYGFIGSCTGTTFNDSNIVPDFTTTPPVTFNPFTGGNNPGCACFFQQRLYYGGGNSFPQTFWASQVGLYNNFNVTNPTIASDAIVGTIVSTQVNYIKSMTPMPGGLVIFTAKGAWVLNAGAGGFASTNAVTPINATANPQAQVGASDVPPIVVNYDILFVQNKGSIVRDLTYNLYAAIYTGTDVSILSNHLFFQHQITQWAFAEEPFKVIWCVRDDGIALSLTFLKEQEISGWARHDTLGTFQSVATVTEGQVDAVYFAVKRFIGGQWLQFIERMADRTFTYGAEDAWCVDCGSQSSLPAPTANLTISTSSGTANFVADAGVFSSASVGSVLRAGGGIATITAYTSPTQVTGTITQAITAVLPNDPNATPLPVASGNWSLTAPATVFYGLDYLNGQTVSILADGGVVAPQVVANGSITLANAATKVTVGLGFQAQLQNMYIDANAQGGTIQGKRKKINACTVRAKEARGLKIGRTFDSTVLVPIKELNQNILLGQPIPLVTADERIVLDPLWNVQGQVCLQQDDPLPATVLGLINEITIGDSP